MNLIKKDNENIFPCFLRKYRVFCPIDERKMVWWITLTEIFLLENESIWARSGTMSYTD